MAVERVTHVDVTRGVDTRRIPSRLKRRKPAEQQWNNTQFNLLVVMVMTPAVMPSAFFDLAWPEQAQPFSVEITRPQRRALNQVIMSCFLSHITTNKLFLQFIFVSLAFQRNNVSELLSQNLRLGMCVE